MSAENYLSPEDYETAAKNGICANTLYRRFHDLGWPKQKAINKPLTKKIPQWVRDKASENGIPYKTLYGRLRNSKMTLLEACTTPLKVGHLVAKEKRVRKHPAELVALATKNGISYTTYVKRVNDSNWEPYEAATRPPMTKQEMGKMARLKKKN